MSHFNFNYNEIKPKQLPHFHSDAPYQVNSPPTGGNLNLSTAPIMDPNNYFSHFPQLPSASTTVSHGSADTVQSKESIQSTPPPSSSSSHASTNNFWLMRNNAPSSQQQQHSSSSTLLSHSNSNKILSSGPTPPTYHHHHQQQQQQQLHHQSMLMAQLNEAPTIGGGGNSYFNNNSNFGPSDYLPQSIYNPYNSSTTSQSLYSQQANNNSHLFSNDNSSLSSQQYSAAVDPMIFLHRNNNSFTRNFSGMQTSMEPIIGLHHNQTSLNYCQTPTSSSSNSQHHHLHHQQQQQQHQQHHMPPTVDIPLFDHITSPQPHSSYYSPTPDYNSKSNLRNQLSSMQLNATTVTTLASTTAAAPTPSKLVYPKWCHYPHTRGVLLSTMNKDDPFQSRNLRYFEKQHLAVDTVEKDVHTMLMNRFRQMFLKLERPNKKEELVHLTSRYVDLNAVENVGLILSSSNKSGYNSICFRGYDNNDQGFIHARLVLNVNDQLLPESHIFSHDFQLLMDQLKSLKHQSLCVIKDVFHFDAFQKKFIAMVSNYRPGCVTVQSTHMNDVNKTKQYDNYLNLQSNFRSAEDLLLMKSKRIWDYLVQIACVLRALHQQGLAYGIMDPTKVLCQEGKRILLGTVGMWEIVNFELDESITNRQERRTREMRQDLFNLGRLMLSLSFGSLSAYANTTTDLPPIVCHALAHHYGDSFVQIILNLLNGSLNVIDDLFPLLAAHVFLCIEENVSYAHHMENYALKESLNSRLFRLLTKLNICYQQPGKPGADETNDRLVLRLFIDFVFHQQLSSGHPMLDLGHVVTCLTKLEGSSNDRISLISPSGYSVFVSYADVLSILTKEFNHMKQSYQAGIIEESALIHAR